MSSESEGTVLDCGEEKAEVRRMAQDLSTLNKRQSPLPSSCLWIAVCIVYVYVSSGARIHIISGSSQFTYSLTYSLYFTYFKSQSTTVNGDVIISCWSVPKKFFDQPWFMNVLEFSDLGSGSSPIPEVWYFFDDCFICPLTLNQKLINFQGAYNFSLATSTCNNIWELWRFGASGGLPVPEIWCLIECHVKSKSRQPTAVVRPGKVLS